MNADETMPANNMELPQRKRRRGVVMIGLLACLLGNEAGNSLIPIQSFVTTRRRISRKAGLVTGLDDSTHSTQWFLINISGLQDLLL